MILPEGWHAVRLTQKSAVPSMWGLALPGTTPVLLARYRCPAPWPDVEVALPLDDEAARDWVSGDPATCALVGYELATALAEFMQAVAAGRDPAEVN